MANVQIPDALLVKSYVAGDESALAALINRHQSKIYGFIYSKISDRDLSDDIFQDTFIKVIKTLKSEKYTEEGKYLPWVITIARNLSIDHFRRSSKMPKITGESGEDIFKNLPIFDENREEQIIQSQKEAKVRELVKLLPQEQQEVLVLRHYADLSFKEISEITQVSINTALGRMRYALHNLRRMIEEKALSLR